MTQTTATPTATATATATGVTAGLRSLHLIRVVFSLLWVALVLTTSGSLDSTDRLSVTAAVLLVVYPLWDVVATLLERRLAGTTDRVSTVNMGLGLCATAAMGIAGFSTVGTALVVFGVWALLSGAVQLVVAVRRRRAVGAQWPMIVSGGQSVLAGATIAATAASPTSTLSTVAGYSAFGAFWFLVSVIALSIRGRRAER
ncbi:DUF308 domain-containing protein [Streptomyces sp. NPDC000983]|uniref:DUF308 domain-containing protein n=1 Tax=Streptomyces sp. NPDC000983 TaxID=3154373 RepID=UPI00332BBDD2